MSIPWLEPSQMGKTSLRINWKYSYSFPWLSVQPSALPTLAPFLAQEGYGGRGWLKLSRASSSHSAPTEPPLRNLKSFFFRDKIAVFFILFWLLQTGSGATNPTDSFTSLLVPQVLLTPLLEPASMTRTAGTWTKSRSESR